jgi:hypothetical protein
MCNKDKIDAKKAFQESCFYPFTQVTEMPFFLGACHANIDIRAKFLFRTF